MSKQTPLLADYHIETLSFEGVDSFFASVRSEEFEQSNSLAKRLKLGAAILKLLESQKVRGFFLPALLKLIDRVEQEKIVETYTLAQFELFLNQFSQLSFEENCRIRGYIMGKWVPREEYQILFPISMGKIYPGPHYVTAHGSPDLDTTVASFWGWVDAFACRVSEGVHRWNLPDGLTASKVEIDLLFHQFFGQSVLTSVAKNLRALSLSSFELMSQKGVIKKLPSDSTLKIDQERTESAVLIVDEAGYYLGDFRSFDVEGVHHVIASVNLCLNWFERKLHKELISLFAQHSLRRGEIATLVEQLLQTDLASSPPAQGFSTKQRAYVEAYLQRVFGIKEGLRAHFGSFVEAMSALGLVPFQEFLLHFQGLAAADFTTESHIFRHLEEVVELLDRAMQSLYVYTEQLGTALKIKHDVFGFMPHTLGHRADIEEIQEKIGAYPSLTVTFTDFAGRLVPMGVIHATEIHKPILGTVTLRDFSNREETKIPPYFDVISLIDHHKSSLNSSAPSVIHVSDGQSSNTLVAELAFQINDRYSRGGMDEGAIDQQIGIVSRDLTSETSIRILRRLLQKKSAFHREKLAGFFISPQRESIEYLHFIYAILDDTDLLTKVAYRDLFCVASLLNRFKSLAVGKEVEIVNFDDLQHEKEFVKKAAEKLLKHPDLYSLYARVYREKEKVVEENILHAAEALDAELFADTKEQNGCARVGQTKLFDCNFKAFTENEAKLRKYWLLIAKRCFEEKPEYDLHLQMISTVASAEELFSGKKTSGRHLDELWIWIPKAESAVAHLKNFLASFALSTPVKKNGVEVEFLGEDSEELETLFTESFLPLPHKKSPEKSETPCAIIRYRAGSLNSRKAAISPYLPKTLVR